MKDEIENKPEKYILRKSVNWFGTYIPQGTIYVQHGKDYYWPIINDAHCPSMQIDFMTVTNNPYFMAIVS